MGFFELSNELCSIRGLWHFGICTALLTVRWGMSTAHTEVKSGLGRTRETPIMLHKNGFCATSVGCESVQVDADMQVLDTLGEDDLEQGEEKVLLLCKTHKLVH